LAEEAGQIVVQPTVIPGNFIVTEPAFPQLSDMTARDISERPVYRFYVWSPDYRLFVEKAAKKNILASILKIMES